MQRASSPSSGHLRAAIMMFVFCGLHFANGQQTIDQKLLNADPVLMHWDSQRSSIIEYDIKLPEDEIDQPQWKRFKRAGVMDPATRWPNNIVPYEITGAFDAAAKATITGSMAEWSAVTCIKFVERTTETNYIKFVASTGCYSYVGRQIDKTTGQDLSLGTGCVFNEIVGHELGHALGLYHEQNRPDRDEFVTVNMQNVMSNMGNNFNKQSYHTVSSYGTPYDYYSLMHYGRYAFSINRGTLDTIVPTDASLIDVIGKAKTMTFLDAKIINSMYQCNAACADPLACNDATKFQAADCACYCQGGTAEVIVDCTTITKTNIWPDIICFVARIFKFLCNISIIATHCAKCCG